MINIKSVILSLIIFLFPMSVCSDSWKEWLKDDLYEEQFLEQTDDIIIESPYRAIDGGNVPIVITTKSKDLIKFTLIIDENPTPCCATFEFVGLLPYIETNIRVNAYTHLTVVAEDIDGNLYVNRKYIKAAGGCSATPIVDNDVPKDRVDIIDDKLHYHLTLSGHTHGMQFGIEIPGFIKWSPIKWRYKYWAGLYEKAGQVLNVNRGFGYLAFPGRVGIWPEITVIKLKKGKPRLG